MQEECLKIWFNPDKNWYEAFMPDGTLLSKLCEITVTDSLKDNPKATISAIVEVVNERPKRKGPRETVEVEPTKGHMSLKG